jgi:hypothetical protein
MRHGMSFPAPITPLAATAAIAMISGMIKPRSAL